MTWSRIASIALAALVFSSAGARAQGEEAPPAAPAEGAEASGESGDAAATAEPAPAPEATEAEAEAEDEGKTEGGEGEATEGATDAAPAPAPAPTTAPAAPTSAPAAPSSGPAAPTSAPEPAAPAPEPTPEPATASQEPEPTPPPASGLDPSVGERRLVAYVATGVVAVSLAAGITLGVLALDGYNCLSDVPACNDRPGQDPIEGDAFLDKKAEVETTALFADMAYVVAAAATVVAVTGYIRGYFLTGEESEEAAQ